VTLRIGHGFDIHRFSADAGRVLVLGGVRFADAPGLEGHSDGDVVAHAVTESVLAAAGLPDIGQLFPDADPQWQGTDSLELLADVMERVGRAGWQVVNVDCTVVTERPKLAPRREEMQARLSERVGAPVTVKGRRAEGLGSIGRSEGIVAMAVALLEERS
jgi:2-C-methyl-D-erythritol 2,4-cyclodiphosphate synthase